VAVLLILFGAFSAPGDIVAQETLGFGLAAGFGSGFGFSFRSMPLSGFGWQPTAIYVETDKLTLQSLGVQGLYVLNHTSSSALYAIAGYGNLYKRTTKDHEVDPGPLPGDEYNESVTTHIRRDAIGLGMGYSYKYPGADKLWASVELMLTSYRGDIFPYPQVAMHYFFH